MKSFRKGPSSLYIFVKKNNPNEIKIGESINPETQRLKSLSYSSGEELDIYHISIGDGKVKEVIMKHCLEPLRKKGPAGEYLGEWYIVDNRDILNDLIQEIENNPIESVVYLDDYQISWL